MENKVTFDLNEEEENLIEKIAERAVKLWDGIDYFTLIMDIAACHLNGCPLDLEKMLRANSFNLGHDVYGIMRHIDRNTGKIENHFLPRCSK